MIYASQRKHKNQINHCDETKKTDQTGRSIRWAHMSVCWFSHETAQITKRNLFEAKNI